MDHDKMLKNHGRALASAKKKKDNFMIATGLDILAYANFREAMGIEDRDKRIET